MADIVLQPHSNTNPSDHFRVVDYGKWLAHVNGDEPAYPFTAYNKYEHARHAALVANTPTPPESPRD